MVSDPEAPAQTRQTPPAQSPPDPQSNPRIQEFLAATQAPPPPATPKDQEIITKLAREILGIGVMPSLVGVKLGPGVVVPIGIWDEEMAGVLIYPPGAVEPETCWNPLVHIEEAWELLPITLQERDWQLGLAQMSDGRWSAGISWKGKVIAREEGMEAPRAICGALLKSLEPK